MYIHVIFNQVLKILIIYLWRKVVCLYFWDPPNWDASDWILGLFGKLLRRRGASAWFHGIWSCGLEVLQYWMIFPLKIKLNHSWKEELECAFGVVGKILMSKIWIHLVRFGFRMWEILEKTIIVYGLYNLNMEISTYIGLYGTFDIQICSYLLPKCFLLYLRGRCF